MFPIHTSFFGLLASCRIILLLIAAFPVFPALADEDAKLDIVSPKDFPDLQYIDEEGKTHSLQAEKSKLTIVHFWATWCAPCVEEFPQVDAMAGNYAGRGVKVVDISMDGDKNMSRIKHFFSEHKITHLVPYLDIGTNAFKEANAQGMPTSFFLDANGKEAAVAEGPLNWQSKQVTEFMDLLLRAKK